MKTGITLATGLAFAATLGTAALSDGHADKAALAAVKARQATMQLYAFNLGILGGMAKGAIEYNADAASAAATNLASLSSMNQMAMWPPGTDNGALGDATAALPAIWNDGGKVMEAGMSLATASAAMAEAAGGGLDGLRGAIGAVGKSCGGCHDTYRKPK